MNWWLAALIRQLNEAGYAVVKKPVLLNKGVPGWSGRDRVRSHD